MTPENPSPGSAAGAPAPVPSTRRSRKVWWILGGLVLLVLIILGARYRAANQAAGPGGRFGMGGPLTVGVAKVTTGDVPVMINALGTVTPLATVTVRPQVNGPLLKVAFTEGQMVKAGELLALIDPAPYKAALDQAAGQLKRDQAALANAKVDEDRYKTLVAQNSVSEQTYATQQATVLQDEATIAADQATVEAAQLNLNYCRITSPVAGRVGLRQVDIGNLMQANTTEIVVVTQMQPMTVLFTVPEDNLSEVLTRMRSGDQLPVDAYDRSLTNKIATGALSTADNQIDTTTGTLKLRADFDNSKLELFPNQFVNVQLLIDTLHNQIVIPGAAMQQGSSGSYVYVVNTDSTVSMRSITTGVTSGAQMVVTKGLTPGETVVVDGADQLRDGARVIVPNGAAPTGASSGAAHMHRPGGSSGGFSSGGEHRHRRDGGTGGPAGPGGPGGPPPP